MAKAKQSKKQRKWGRNTDSCRHYAATNRRERNKLVRLARHLKRFPDDSCAIAAVDHAKSVIRGY